MSDVRPGRLKVYLGAAPGVGKTYRMLDEGRRRAARGADVVVGFAECAGGPVFPPTDGTGSFEPFQRLGDTDNTTGLGLGLALARGLTEAMNGTLTPEDTPGGGLTMVVSLPFADRTGP